MIITSNGPTPGSLGRGNHWVSTIFEYKVVFSAAPDLATLQPPARARAAEGNAEVRPVEDPGGGDMKGGGEMREL